MSEEQSILRDPRVGTSVGNYRLDQLIGQGAFGSVYLAIHPNIQRKIAVKVLDKHQPDVIKRFMAEARAASSINHPNIIEIFDQGETEDGHFYYYMEALEGEDLERIVQRQVRKHGRMSPTEAAPYIQQVCSALHAAHGQGIVHRDLKPENIFLVGGEGGVVKVLDFGIAKLLEAEAGEGGGTKTGMIMGTPLYMAPEQCAGRVRDISARSDIYSIGVMIYYCLGGRHPFKSDAYTQILMDHINEPPPPLGDLEPSLPGDLVDLVMSCLAKDPAERPQTAAEVWGRYEAATADVPVPDMNLGNFTLDLEVDAPDNSGDDGPLPAAATGLEMERNVDPLAVTTDSSLMRGELADGGDEGSQEGARTRRSKAVYLLSGGMLLVSVVVVGMLMASGADREPGPVSPPGKPSEGPVKPALTSGTPPPGESATAGGPDAGVPNLKPPDAGIDRAKPASQPRKTRAPKKARKPRMPLPRKPPKPTTKPATEPKEEPKPEPVLRPKPEPTLELDVPD